MKTLIFDYEDQYLMRSKLKSIYDTDSFLNGDQILFKKEFIRMASRFQGKNLSFFKHLCLFKKFQHSSKEDIFIQKVEDSNRLSNVQNYLVYGTYSHVFLYIYLILIFFYKRKQVPFSNRVDTLEYHSLMREFNDVFKLGYSIGAPEIPFIVNVDMTLKNKRTIIDLL